MSIIKKMRKQHAVLWIRSDAPDRFGRFSYGSPAQIKCRWEDVVQEFRDSQGQATVSRSIVYVDRIIKAGDMLKRGELESDTPSDPRDEPELAWEVRRFDQLPKLNNKETLLTAYL